MTATVSGDRQAPWLSELKATWLAKPIKYVASINRMALSEATDPETVIRYIDISSVNKLGQITDVVPMSFAAAPSRARRVVRYGDTIVSTVRTYLRAVAPVPEDDENLIASTGFAVVSPQPQLLDARYLSFWLRGNHFVDEVCARSVGVSYPATNSSEVGAIPIPVPPLSTQRAIANFLDRKTAGIDALIAKKRRLVELLAEKRAALINQAVTKGLDPTVPMKNSGIPWIGEIPAHWLCSRLSFRYDQSLGKMLNPDAASGDHLAPYLTNRDVRWDRVDVSNLSLMSFSRAERSRLELKIGDLLVCEGGEVGRTAIWRGELDECYFQKAIHRLRPRDYERDHTRYFYYVLRTSAERGTFLGHGNQNTIPHLTGEQIRAHRFPFPPYREQVMIAEYLDTEVSATESTVELIASQLERLQEYRQALITAAVTGQLEIPVTEPEEVLV